MSYIANADGSMFVHEIRGVVFVTWVAKVHINKARQFPADAVKWAEFIADITGVDCKVVSEHGVVSSGVVAPRRGTNRVAP